MKLTVDRFWEILKRYPASRYVVGYSGGLDSTVLLKLCARLKQIGLINQLCAVHIDHGLHPKANEWSDHCEKVAELLAVDFQLKQVEASGKPGESPEDAARKARYQAFNEIISDAEVLLIAHHQDDQTETILLQLFRGSGVDGLCGMGDSIDFGAGQLVRPLLTFSRQSVADFAFQFNLQWVDDSSNQDSKFDRNYVRHEILPAIKARWPGVGHTVARSGHHIAEAKRILDRTAQRLLEQVRIPTRNTLKVGGIKSFNEADQCLVIRQWIKLSGFQSPSTAILNQVIRSVVEAGLDKNPRVIWDEAEINRFDGELYLLPKRFKFDHTQIIHWNGQGILSIPEDNGYLTVRKETDSGITAKYWHEGKITVRFRIGGETCRLPRRRGTRSLKKLFQEQSIPPWVRKRIPLIYMNDKLAAAVGLWVFEPYSAVPGEDNYQPQWIGHKLGWKIGDSDVDLV